MTQSALSAVALLALLLTGCQFPPQHGGNSTTFNVPGGSTLTLNQALTIPPHSLKIYIQNGRLGFGPNEYYPFCKFELRQLKDTSQVVQPGAFEIYQTRRASGLMAGIPRRTRLAGLESFDIEDGKPSPVLYSIQLFLRSATQPDVYKLSCGHLQDPGFTARYPSLQEIREALGNVFTLQVAAG
jgi:hypothetical protein